MIAKFVSDMLFYAALDAFQRGRGSALAAVGVMVTWASEPGDG